MGARISNTDAKRDMNIKTTGQGMMALSIILGIAILTLFFGKLEEKQYNPNTAPLSLAQEESIEVSLVQNRQGHYVVTGEINHQSVVFLLDTGATDVVVPERIARRLGLAYGRPSQAMTANGVITIWQTNIDELRIGDIRLQKVAASINPKMASESILLGMSALRRIEFIQQGDSLTLRQKSL